ncbi:MAG: hypothetical protein ACYCX4_11040, partial [Bacillota bacterium]
DFDKKWNVPKGPTVSMTIHHSSGTEISIDTDGKMTLKGIAVNIGNGSKKVACVGDTVEVNVPGVGIVTGEITTGSNLLKTD